jgi:protein-S-isoprenylcysteine O-methyltransferase Ste14
MLAMDSSIIGRAASAIESSISRMSIRIVTLVRWPVGPAQRAVGAGLLASGLAGVLWCVRVMRGRRRRDRGRPPPRDDGPYRFVRHPMCAAVLVFAFGSALVTMNSNEPTRARPRGSASLSTTVTA